ncbi:hypothetical protein D3C76_1049170 [compost metagenome]
MSPISVLLAMRSYIANHRAFWSRVRSLPGRMLTTTNFLSRNIRVSMVTASESLAWLLTEIFSAMARLLGHDPINGLVAPHGFHLEPPIPFGILAQCLALTPEPINFHQSGSPAVETVRLA